MYIDLNYLQVKLTVLNDKIVEGSLPTNLDLYRLFTPEIYDRINKERAYSFPRNF